MTIDICGLRCRWLVLGLMALLSGCSVQRMAANKLGDVLAAGGTTYSADSDPELIEAAMPFSLKLMESVLAASPEHRELLAATAAGFTQFAYAFVQQEAERTALQDYEKAQAISARARGLYLRARDYGLRGLDDSHPGMSDELRRAPRDAVARIGLADVDLIYWTAASWAAAIGLGKDEPGLVADMPIVSALIDRALELNESWNRGAIHSFMVTWEMVRPDSDEGREQRARRHLLRAVELSRGHESGPWVTWAEAVCLPQGDRSCLENSLNEALKVDPDAYPPSRLANVISQRRAAWLIANADRWILPPLDNAIPNEESPQ